MDPDAAAAELGEARGEVVGGIGCGGGGMGRSAANESEGEQEGETRPH